MWLITSDIDKDRIIKAQENVSTDLAIMYLLNRVSQHKPNWLAFFLQALKTSRQSSKYEDLVNTMEPKLKGACGKSTDIWIEV